MLKLIESSEGIQKSHLFQEDTILIGDGLSSNVHLSFPGRGLKNEHVKLVKTEKGLIAINLANDPFVSINGLPFFKKKFEAGDVLKIKQIEITLASDLKPVVQPVEPEQIPLPDPEVEIKKEIKKLAEITPKPLETSKSETSKKSDPEKLFDDLEEDDIVTVPIKKAKSENKFKRSLKDGDFEKSEKEKRPFSPPQYQRPFRFLRYFSFLFGFLIIAGLIITLEAYLTASEKSNMEELKAAESLSDIAMAFTYAQLNHIEPQKHNWSDPEFIQNNLLATLPTGTSQPLRLDAHGAFGDSSYLLRVYTSNDLSRFLLVAHPAPSWIQWLIPKNSIIVDSTTMELKKISDLKSINRLLSSLNTLDGINVSQISEMVKKGELISLSHLAKASQKPEFAPPKAIQFLRPGAENLIYNAPRYHSFSDQLIKKAAHFANLSSSSHELRMLKSELEVLKKLPNLILYTSDGIELANLAIKGLKEIQPEAKFLLAYLKYDQNGRIRSSQIIMDHNAPEPEQNDTPFIAEATVIPITPEVKPEPEIQYGTLETKEEIPTEIASLDEDPKKHLVNAILLRIHNDKLARLQPLKKEVEAALKKYLLTENAEDLRAYELIYATYQHEKANEDERVKKELISLLYELDDLEWADLDQAIKDKGLNYNFSFPKPVYPLPLYNKPTEVNTPIQEWFINQLEIH